MRKIALLLLVMGVSYAANTTITSSNSTVSLAYGDCVNVTGGENWTMVCAPGYPQLNINRTLAYSEVYTIANMNATFISPPQQTWNVFSYLQAGEIITNSTFNATIVCMYPNITKTLVGDSTYTNNSISISCYNERYNISDALDYGEEWEKDDINVTLTCADYPSANVNANINPGQQWTSMSTDPRLNITITAASCADTSSLNTSLAVLQTKYDLCVNTTKTCPECETCPECNLTTCSEVSVAEEMTVEDMSSTFTACMNKNSTALLMCASDLTTLACTDTEKLNGDYLGCMNRIINSSTEQYSLCYNEKVKIQEDYNRCNNSTTAQQENQDNLIVIIVGAMTIVMLIGLVVYVAYRRQRIEVSK